MSLYDRLRDYVLSTYTREEKMPRTALSVMKNPDVVDRAVMTLTITRLGYKREQAKAAVALLVTQGQTVHPDESTKLMAEAKLPAGSETPTIAAKAAALETLATARGLPGTFDWTAIITAILSALTSCGL